MSTKLRILCLHGFTSNGAVHAHQMRKLTSLLPEYEFLFPDGPHRIDLASTMDMTQPGNQAWGEVVNAIGPKAGPRAWWRAREANPEKKVEGGFYGLEESVRSIGEFLRDVGGGPVHAITGFSQGACFAGMLIALLQDRSSGSSLRGLLGDVEGMGQQVPRAGIIFSGFRARFERYDELYEGGIEVPTLHVIGERDEAVTPERSEVLVRVCMEAEELRHDGAHDIPKAKEDQVKIVEFLRKWVGGVEGERVSPSL